MKWYLFVLKRAAAIILWWMSIVAFVSAVNGGERAISPAAYVLTGIVLSGVGLYSWRSAAYDRAIFLTPTGDEGASEIDEDVETE